MGWENVLPVHSPCPSSWYWKCQETSYSFPVENYTALLTLEYSAAEQMLWSAFLHHLRIVRVQRGVRLTPTAFSLTYVDELNYKKKKNANHKKTLIVSSVVFVSLRRVFCSLFFPSSPRHLAARQLLRCWSHCQPQQRLQRKRKLSQRHCKKRCDTGTRAVEVALLAWSSLPAAGRKSKPPLRFSAGGKVRLPGFEWRKSPCV